MFELVGYLILIYLYLFFSGIGLYFVVTPTFLRKNYLAPFLPPLYGQIFLSILGFYLVIFNLKISFIFWVSISISILLLIIIFVRQREKLITFLKNLGNDLIQNKIAILIAFVVVLSLLFPLVKAGYSTTPFRIGIDEVMYIENTQFLIDGGTLQSLRNKIATADGTSLRHDVLCNTLNFLLFSRYGEVIVFSLLAYVTACALACKIIFLSLIFNYIFIGFIVFYFLKESFQIKAKWAFIGALTFMFNCNLINIYYEGGYAQLFAMPFLVFAFILIMKLRENKHNELTSISYIKLGKESWVTWVKKRWVKLFALIISIGCILVINYYSPDIIYKEQKNIQYNNINYNSSSNDSALSKVYEKQEKDKADTVTTNIDFEFKIHSLTGYHNLFQTASVNDGIRLELSSSSKVGLLIGNLPEGWYELANKLQLNKWYKIEICVDGKRNTVAVILDKKKILSQKNVKLKYEISDIAIGSGFSKTRLFNGEVKDFNIKYSLFNLMNIRQISVIILIICLYISLIVLSFLLLNNTSRTLKSIWDAILCLMVMRSLERGLIENKDMAKSVVLLSVIIAITLFTYNESIFVFIAMLVVINILDIVFYKNVDLKSSLLVLLALFLGLIIASPIVVQFLSRLTNILEQVRYSGFHQPNWAMPSEIIGIFDIYSKGNFFFQVAPRNSFNFIVNCTISVVAILLFIKTIIKSKIDKLLWIAPAIVIVIVYLNSILNNRNNYSYMKIYTLLLPFIFVVFYSSYFIYKNNSNRSKLLTITNESVKYLSISAIIISGFLYINLYNHTSNIVSKDMFEAVRFIRSKNFQDKVFVFNNRANQVNKTVMENRLFEHIFISSLQINWVDQGFIPQSQNSYKSQPILGEALKNYVNYTPHLSKDVYLIIDLKSSNFNLNKIMNKNNIVFKNDELLIIDTEKKLCDSLRDTKLRIFDFKIYWNIIK